MQTIDDERHDIFLHVDKKWKDATKHLFRNTVVKAKLYIAEHRHDVQWGGRQMVYAELDTMDFTRRTGSFRYYHLLSSYDMPIAGSNQIYEYFSDKTGTYIDADTNLIPSQYLRYSLFHF